MNEERFVEEQIENINVAEVVDTVIPVLDETIILSSQNETIDASIEEDETFNVSISEDVGPHALKIVTDHSFGLPRQHSIGAIEGLREELDEVERLKTVYSDDKNQANYYMWKDENPNQENRDGYFVSIHQDDNTIQICTAEEDEFGVTVSGAGFVGYQNKEIPRGSNYGLVVHSGLVGVRCGTDVEQGNYVVSDDNGVAQKTDGTYGYLVTAISNINGVRHAIISLTMPTTQMQRFSETAQDVAKRMDSAETNIATAISVANAAYNKAQVAQEWVQGNVENIAGDVVIIGGKVDDIVTDVDGLKDSVAGSIVQSDKAYDIATKAQQYASDTKVQVETELNNAHTTINNLTDAVAPITTWVGYDENGVEVEGASYFVQHIDKNFLETKTQIETVQTLTEENQTAISKNAESIQLLATSIDEYSIGEWSQAYGLTLSQAWSILNPGMIYIPTPETHDEKYEYDTVDTWDEQNKDRSIIYRAEDTGLYWRSVVKKDENDNLTNQWKSVDLTTTDGDVYIIEDQQSFTRGYYYTWNGFYWVESEHPYVYFSASYVLPSEECKYWYRDVDEDLEYNGVIYKAHGLYMVINNEWTEVNILDGNITNRVASMIDQTANSISLDVSNARGDIADLSIKVDEQGSQVAIVAANSEPSDIKLDGEVESFEELPVTAQNGVYYAVGQKVYKYNGIEWKEQYHLTYDGIYVKKINAANIIAAVNNDESTVAINADKINFNGYATFTDDGSGLTGISGDLIHTGTIAANDGTVKIDLGVGTACVSGRIAATSGYIGDEIHGFTIAEQNGQLLYIVPKSEIDGVTNTLEKGTYYFKYNDKDYKFTLTYELTEGDKITINNDISYYKVNGEFEDFLEETSDNIPESKLLTFVDASYYYLGQGQKSVKGNREGTPGIFISPEGVGLGNGNFYVDDTGNVSTSGIVSMKSGGNEVVKIENGNLTLAGNITLGGSITWSTSSNPLKVLYRETYTATAPTKDDYEEAYKTGTVWHTELQDNDYYASYSYDGGVNWTTPIKIKGEDGQPGENADIDAETIFDMLTDGGESQGVFPFYGEYTGSTDKPQLYINAEYIKAGILSGVTVESVNDDNDKIRLNNSHIHFIDGNTRKLDMGFYDFGTGASFPYMVFGAGTNSNSSSTNPIAENTGYLYKSALNGTNWFKIGLNVDTETWKNELSIAFTSSAYERWVDFGNSNVKFGDKKSTSLESETIEIDFGKSNVDFSDATVSGLNITFG